MSLSVGELVDDPLIRTRFRAGQGGAGRLVNWAHTCEVADPWHWMGSGDLLMTDGYGFPASPQEQVEFIRNLAASDIAAIAVGEGFAVPPLSEALIKEADTLNFPVLETAHSVPFVTIARMVADRNRGPAAARASHVLRLYDILRRSHAPGGGNATLLADLGREMRARLHVIDVSRGRELMPAAVPLSATLRDAALDTIRKEDGRLSAFNRIQHDGETTLLLPVGIDGTSAMLVCAGNREGQADLVLAQHAAMIAELDVARREQRLARSRDRGAALLRRLLDADIATETAVGQLLALGVGNGPWRVTAWQAETGEGEGDPAALKPPGARLAEELLHVPWPSIQSVIHDTHLVVVSDDLYTRGLDVDLSAITSHVGVSQPLASPQRFADAFREARWALESARSSDARIAVYGSHGSYFMPRTVAEGEAAVARLLGPLIEYDTANDAKLIESLQTYFDVNRSWQAGARRLGIHKQTLVYRMKKVEDLTGMDLRNLGSQAELYLALKTRRLLQTD